MSSVYAWGSNSMHQLSHKDSLHFYEPSLFADFEGRSPVAVATGDGHSLVLTDTGEVFTFGRGKEGQLGNGQQSTATSKDPQVVAAIQNETIASIAAGSLTSYAVTATGKVYQWGLIHRDNPRDQSDQEVAAASGQLTGLAADQANTVIQVDHEARAGQQQHSTSSVSSDAEARERGGGGNHRSRVLRDIILDSTERWMLANDGADDEYYRELKSIGYQNEEVELMIQSRGREYHGMLRMGCRRVPCFLPEVIHLSPMVRIASVAAGYAHCMLLTVSGQLYAAGYNDRGQLGLGHRINTSEFKHVDFLLGKIVLQVACGQQHTVCRAVDNPSFSGSSCTTTKEVQRSGGGGGGGRGSDHADLGITHAPLVSLRQEPHTETTATITTTATATTATASTDTTADATATSGGDAYVWGSGMLGQLGLGRLGTSKGRLLPTLLSSLHTRYPAGIVDVSAGGNFTVVVACDGQVFSFGHSEYNQHGTGAHSQTDYIDPFHFYTPQPLVIENPDSDDRSSNGNDEGRQEYEVAPTWARSGTTVSATNATTAANAAAGTSLHEGREQDSEGKSRVHIVRVSCGSDFTVAIDVKGDVYTWGWHECGVLGHGSGFFSSAPRRIDSLGHRHDGKTVIAVCAGAKHVLALTEVQSNSWAGTYRHLLSASSHENKSTSRSAANTAAGGAAATAGAGNGVGAGAAGVDDDESCPGVKYADVRIVIDNNTGTYSSGTMDIKEFLAHSVVLAARSKYLRGFLRSAAAEAEDNLNRYALADAFDRSGEGRGGGLCDTDLTSANDETTSSSTILTVTLSSPHANSITVQSLLEYLYLDRLSVPQHKKLQLAELARELCLHRLVWMCTKRPFECLSTESIAKLPSKWISTTSWSTFTSDMEAAINDEFCDVVFLASSPSSPTTGDDNSSADASLSCANAGIGATAASASSVVSGEDGLIRVPVLYAHRSILSRIPYFEALFNHQHQFCESIADAQIDDTHTTSNPPLLLFSGSTGSRSSSKSRRKIRVSVNADILVADGVDVNCLIQLVGYAYTGEILDPSALRYHYQDLDNNNKGVDPDPQLLKLKRSGASSTTGQYETDIIGLLIAANRAGFTLLALQCERMISLNLAASSDMTQASDVLEFAVTYGLPRLEMQCRELLKPFGGALYI